MAAGSNLTADSEKAFVQSDDTGLSEQDSIYKEENLFFGDNDTETSSDNASVSDTSDTPHTEVSSKQNAVSEDKAPSSSSSTPQSVPQSGTAGGSSSAKPEAAPSRPSQVKPVEKTEMRAVWISFLEYQSILKNKSESQFKSSVKKYFDNCVSYLKQHVKENDVVMTLGAGTVTQIGPMLVN